MKFNEEIETNICYNAPQNYILNNVLLVSK